MDAAYRAAVRATPEPLLHSPEEAAMMLRTSRSGVYGLIRRGELKSVKVGKLRRITRAELEAYVARLEAAR